MEKALPQSIDDLIEGYPDMYTLPELVELAKKAIERHKLFLAKIALLKKTLESK